MGFKSKQRKVNSNIGFDSKFRNPIRVNRSQCCRNEEREVDSCSPDENDNFGNTGDNPDNPKSKISNIPDENKSFYDPKFDPYEGSISNIENYVEPSFLKSTRKANRFKKDPILPNLRPPPKPNFNFLKLKKSICTTLGSNSCSMKIAFLISHNQRKRKKVAKSGSLTKRPNVFKSFFT
jgi:hypothetical protein